LDSVVLFIVFYLLANVLKKRCPSCLICSLKEPINSFNGVVFCAKIFVNLSLEAKQCCQSLFPTQLEALEGFCSRFEPEAANSPALLKPLDYTLVWSTDDGSEERYGGCGFFRLPQLPEDYKPLGFLVTTDKPGLDEVRCVRAELADEC
jgi:hypothetical protein